MMNHMPAGPGQTSHINQTMPHHQSRRQQEYHAYHHGPPQSPMHPHPYANFHAPYYAHHVQQQQYPPARWQHQPTYMPQSYMPMQQMQQSYQPRSPMIVSSQPHGQTMPQMMRHPSQNQIPHHTSNSRPVSQHVQQPTHIPAPPSPVPTPKKEHESPAASPVVTSRRQSHTSTPSVTALEVKTPYYPQLPWYSPLAGPADFPARHKSRRKRRIESTKLNESLALPNRGSDESPNNGAEEPQSEISTLAASSELETPATSQAPSETDFAQTTPPANPGQATQSLSKDMSTTQPTGHVRKDTRTAIAIPNLPIASRTKPIAQDLGPKGVSETITSPVETVDAVKVEQTDLTTEQVEKKPDTPAAPKSWADLVRIRANNANAGSSLDTGNLKPTGNTLSKSAPLAEALKQYNVEEGYDLSFLEPRGLVNTGNMCYMNSILQVLVFCSPFYSLLDQVRQRTVHSMKSQTPLLDAMIMFMREFKELGNADSAESLTKKLKPEQLEQYGEPVTPEYVYDAIRKLPRFQTMRRGHQQDAEEFLGFLLEGLHDECVTVMAGQPDTSTKSEDTASTRGAADESADGWLEVGPKQKSSITRTSGVQDIPSPIDKIFGGHLRSELRVAGLKDSVTLEPYKPLQLDIGAVNVNNIVEALKGLTRSEALVGDFGGRNNSAKKQVFIDTLPPVLILHLKRFQYDNASNGTQKIWKKVGYPLELEIPKEVFPPSKRNGLAVKGGLPRYRLISVVYHHGKSAAGGHYTVDVLRQDGRDWVRMDDTVIRRVRSEEVAEGGAEEDPKLLARALEQHKADQDLQKQRNMYEGLDQGDGEIEDERPWSEVNGSAHSANKKWAAIVNADGTATPSSATGKRTPIGRREGVKDNKVAYILLYERVRP